MNLSAKATVTRLRRIRPNRTWALLLVAVTVGGLAAVSARSYLAHQMQAIEATAKGKTVTVIVAKRDLAKGAVLSADNMALRPIPAEYAHSAALLPDDFERVDGQRLGYPVKSGEMILWGLMETQRAPTFSAHVTSGRRAMTVPVDEIRCVVNDELFPPPCSACSIMERSSSFASISMYSPIGLIILRMFSEVESSGIGLCR